MKALQRAVEILGSQAKLAEAIGGKVRQAHVSYWLVKAGGLVPPVHCAAIERATGGMVSRYELRPDIFGATPDIAPITPALTIHAPEVVELARLLGRSAE